MRKNFHFEEGIKMKKTLSMILCAMLVAAMGVSASASNIAEEDRGNIKFGIKGIADTVEWTPDGEWTEGEYAEIDVKNTWISSACADDANDESAKNLDFKLGMSWDSKYIYGYVEFEDANGYNNTWGADPSSMWYSGALQICWAEADAESEDRLEYGIGLTSDTDEKISNVWGLKNYDAPVDDFEVFVDGDHLIYEFRTPVDGFSSVAAKEGSTYGFCLVISWGNDQDHIHTQISSGCTGDAGKQAANFAKVTLEEAMVVETEPETVEAVADEAPAADAAPQTFDAGIVAAVAAIVSAAGYAVSKKR